MSDRQPSLLVQSPSGSWRAAWVGPPIVRVDRDLLDPGFRAGVVARTVAQRGEGRREGVEILSPRDAFGPVGDPKSSSSSGHHHRATSPAAQATQW